MTQPTPYNRDTFVRMGEAPLLDGNTLVGYAAVWDSPTEINSWEGKFTEVIRKGAFTRTLKNNGDRVKVLYDHGFDPSVGNKPLGVPKTLHEDERGLFYEVELDDTSYNSDLKASLKSGAIDGSSFRFSVPKGGDRWEDDGAVRELVEVQLYELGPVTFPAYQAATAGIRSADAFRQWRAGETGVPVDITAFVGGYTTDDFDVNQTTTNADITVLDDLNYSATITRELVGPAEGTPTDPPPMALAKRFAQLARRADMALREHRSNQ